MRAMALLARAGMVPTLLHRAADVPRLGLTALGPARRTTSPSWPPSLHVPGSPAPAWRRPTVLHRARRRAAPPSRRAAWPTTWRSPTATRERSTDPWAAVAGAEAVFVGARPYAADEPARPAGVTGRVARYAWDDHVGALRDGLWEVAHRLRADGWKAVAFADDNSIVDREVGPPRRHRLVRQERQPARPRRGELVRARLRDHHGARCRSRAAPVADGCGSCRRCIDDCPTGAIVEPGVIDARRCLSWLLQKPGTIEPRWRRSIGDRLYGCDDCQDVCPPTVRSRARRAGRVRPPGVLRSSTCSPCSTPTTTVCSPPGGGGTSPSATRGGRGATRWSCWATPPIRGDPAVRDALARYVVHPDAVLRVHAIWAARRLGLSHLVPPAADEDDPGVRAELDAPVEPHVAVAAAGEAPPRDQRLPAEDRRDPVAAVGVVAAPAAGVVRRAHQPVRRRRGVRPRPAVPHRARPRAGAAAAPVDDGADQRDGRARRRRPGRARPGVPARHRRPVAGPAVRRHPPRRRGHRARPAPGQPAGARARAAPRPPRSSPAAPTRRPRASMPPAARCRSRSSRRASTSTASCRSTTPPRRDARAHFGLPVDGELIVAVSRLVPRKGFDTAIRAAAQLRRGTSRSRRWRSPARVATSTACERLAGELRAPVRFLGRVANDDLPALYGCGDVYAMLCRNRWGGLEQEGFGIVFLEAAACGVPQVAGASGGAAEAVVDGETGIVVRRPADTSEVAAAFARSARRSGRHAADGPGGQGPGRRRVLLRRARRAPGSGARGTAMSDDETVDDEVDGATAGTAIVRYDIVGTALFVVAMAVAVPLRNHRAGQVLDRRRLDGAVRRRRGHLPVGLHRRAGAVAHRGGRRGQPVPAQRRDGPAARPADHVAVPRPPRSSSPSPARPSASSASTAGSSTRWPSACSCRCSASAPTDLGGPPRHVTARATPPQRTAEQPRRSARNCT